MQRFSRPIRLLAVNGSLAEVGCSLNTDQSYHAAASQLLNENPDPLLVGLPRLPGLAPGGSRAIVGPHYDDMGTNPAADADDLGLFFFHSPLHFFLSFSECSTQTSAQRSSPLQFCTWTRFTRFLGGDGAGV